MFNKQSPQTTKDISDILKLMDSGTKINNKAHDITMKTATEFLTLLKILKSKGLITAEESLKVIEAGEDA
jgi:hypothetical protein